MLWKNVRGKDKALLEKFQDFDLAIDWVEGWAHVITLKSRLNEETLRLSVKYDSIEIQIVDPPKMVKRWEASGSMKIVDEMFPVSKIFEYESEAKRFAEALDLGVVKEIEVPE